MQYNNPLNKYDMKYEFHFNGEMPNYIIEFIPFIDELEGTGSVMDRETGHTVNIYSDNISEALKREIFLSGKYRRMCPRDVYFLEEEKEISPTVNVLPLRKCPIYRRLNSLAKYIETL